MKKYPEYRESGSELIDMLPTHWRIVPLTKYLNSIIDYRGRTPKKIENGGQLLVTARNIKMGRIDYSLSEEYVDPEDAQALLNRGKPEIGDVLFTTEAPLGEVANVDNVDIALAQRIVKFSGKKDILDNFFLKYWILSHTFQNDLLSHATGSTAKGIKASKFNILKLVLPTYTEQKQISLFLDIKTVQINSLIDKKQQMIELLKEERAAIINQAVTKGINPDAEMKDSGIEWLGEVPKHWELNRMKFACRVNPNKDESIQKDCNDSVCFLPMECVGVDGIIDQSNLKPISTLFSGFTFFKKNDIILAKITPCFENGKGALLSELQTEFGFGSTEFHVLRVNEHICIPQYIYYITISQLFRSIGTAFMTGSAGQKRVPTDFLKDFVIAIPPLPEQIKICSELQSKLTKITNALQKIEKEISLIEEYRASLINEAVTGKIDIR